jgi:phage-related protein
MAKDMPPLKPVTFLGSSRDDLRDMPESVRHAIGVELMTVQMGGVPSDFKPIPSVGAGAYEIRVRDAAGAFRTVYVTKFADAIYVLHAFQKKTQKTATVDLELARRRYKLIPGVKA